ncbi:cytochrome-c peroxidase [Pseudaestuariivita sp.]|uniref:cytochrome-c peroxidase n=1 Tax=Pseudaestuariivita sp. TaxID=2211669 RepID=UPI00405857A9
MGRALNPRTFLAGAACLAASIAQADTLPRALEPADFFDIDIEMAAIGRNLFFDKVLSGNDNISCSTCHHPALGTGDGMALPLGEGGVGLGHTRIATDTNIPLMRVPRNAPPLFNLGARGFEVFFQDGRMTRDRDAPFGIQMPKGNTLERRMPTMLSAQNLLPILNVEEMAGQPDENAIGLAVAENRLTGEGGAWDLIAKKVEAIPEYRQAFDWIIGPDEPLHISHIGIALSSFISYEFRAANTPFDRYLRGDNGALTDVQMQGMELFYGDAGCASCHSGTLMSDFGMHALALPQFGPGKRENPDFPHADEGHMRASGAYKDIYTFRTPMLRNVALTAPYGHNGAFTSLEGIVRHHLNPIQSLGTFDRDQVLLHDVPSFTDDWVALDAVNETLQIAAAVSIAPVELEDAEVDALLSFLEALTDPVAITGRLGIPLSVPSGLSIDMPAQP